MVPTDKRTGGRIRVLALRTRAVRVLGTLMLAGNCPHVGLPGGRPAVGRRSGAPGLVLLTARPCKRGGVVSASEPRDQSPDGEADEREEAVLEIACGLRFPRAERPLRELRLAPAGSPGRPTCDPARLRGYPASYPCAELGAFGTNLLAPSLLYHVFTSLLLGIT